MRTLHSTRNISIPSTGTASIGMAAPQVYPAWFNPAAPLNQWNDIPNTASSMPSPMFAYSGWTKMGLKLVSAAPGGHTDSGYNGVLVADLSADNPSFVEVTPASPSNIQVQSAVGALVNYYSDGHPISRHTRYNVQWVPALNRVMLIGGRDVYSGPGISNQCLDGWNPDTHQWDPQGTWPDTPTMPNGGAFVLPNGTPFAAAGTGYLDVTVSPPVWRTDITGASASVRYPWVAAPQRDIAFGFCVGDNWGYGDQNAINAQVVSGKNFTNITIAPSAARSQLLIDSMLEAGMTYDEGNDQFLMYSGFNTGLNRVYAIKPNNTTTWDISILPTTGVALGQPTGGLQSRFSYIPEYKCVIMAPVLGQNLKYMRLS